MSQKGTIVIPITLVAEGGGSDSAESFQSILSGASPSPSVNKSDKNQKKAEVQGKSSANIARAVIVNATAKIASLALSGYGDITGDYVKGQNIQTAIREGGKLLAATSMGPWGMGAYAVDKGIQAFQYYGALKKSEAMAEFAQKRVYGTTVKS